MLSLRAVRRSILLGLCLLGVGLVLGCGYQLIRAPKGGELQRVAIRGFSNDSFEPGVELLVSDALRREFLRRGEVRLVDDSELADLVIAGAVEEVDVRRRSFSSISFSLEYEVKMNLALAVTQPDGTELRLDGRTMNETERFLASADVEVTRTNREEALRRLASLLAVRIHDVLTAPVTP